jgi:DNA polymerase I-like protein with 3'-5' exonuclease and polymerase domains
MDTVVVLDVETSKKPILHPWQKGSFLSLVGASVFGRDLPSEGVHYSWLFTHDEQRPEVNVATIRKELQGFFDCYFQPGKDTLLVGHNIKFDMNWLKSQHLDLHDVRIWDTQIAEYMLCGQRKDMSYSLNAACQRRDIELKQDAVKTYWEAGINTDKIPLHILSPYLAQDIKITAELFKKQYAEARVHVNKNFMKLLRLRCDTLHIITDMELNGMAFDRVTAEQWTKKFRKDLESSTNMLLSIFGQDDINLDSGPELSACLYGGKLKRTRKVPYVYTKNVIVKEPYKYMYRSGKRKGQIVTKYKNRTLKMLTCRPRNVDYEVPVKGVGFTPPKGSETATEGVYQTNKDVLRQLTCSGKRGLPAVDKKEVIRLLMHRSKIEKFVNTFEGKKQDTGLYYKADRNIDGYLHPLYNQTVTSTGRLSSSGDMNGQNTARSGQDDEGFSNPMKACFPSRLKGGSIVVGDLAQLEWRIAAWLSQDPVMIAEIKSGVDIHAKNAQDIFGDVKYRQVSKIKTFRSLYGGTPYAYYMDPAFPNFSLRKWQAIEDGFRRKYVVLHQWQEQNISSVGQNDGWLYSPTGRAFLVPQEPHKKYPGVMVYKETCIKNYPVQGTATADVMPLAMHVVDKRIKHAWDIFKGVLWIGQVHDSCVFDSPGTVSVHQLAELIIRAYEDLPMIISKYWGLDMNIPLTGDVTWGPTYGNQIYKMKHNLETDQWEVSTK